MTYQVVGFTKYEPTSSTGTVTFSIPVPTGTEVGDLLVVGTWGASWMSVPDSRLVEVDNPNFYPAGAYGVATDLSDIQVTSTNGAGNDDPVVALAIRNYGTVQSAQAVGLYTRFGGDESIFGADPSYYAAVAVVMALGTVPGGGSGWDTAGTALAGGVYAQAYTFSGSSGVPALNMATITGAPTVGAMWIIFDGVVLPTATTTTYLRQRQSPVRTPSRVRPPVVRQRQRPEVT